MANAVGTSTITVAVAAGATAYGVVLTLSFYCVYLLWSSRARAMRWRLIIYVSWTLLLATCAVAFQVRYTQAFLSSQPPSDLSRNIDVETALTFIQHWSTDGLVLYRCYIIYAFKIKIFIGFGLLYAACVVIGCTHVVVFGIEYTEGRYLMLAYLCVGTSLHVFLQSAVIGRVLYFRRVSRRVNAIPNKAVTSQHRDAYASIASILIESASLDTTITIVYFIGFLLNNSLAMVSSFLVGPVLAIASLLIIVRVGHGRGWSSSTSHRLTGSTAEINQSGMVFADHDRDAGADSAVANSIV